MEQDNQIPRALVEHAIARLCESHTQLSQLSLDLRCDRELRRRVARIAAVQMLLDGVVNLRDGQGLDLQQLIKEVVDRFPPTAVSVEDSLRPTVTRDGRIRLEILWTLRSRHHRED